MEEERFKNINILDLAHIVFFNEDAGGTILEELSREEGILERISDAIREQSFNILVDRNSMMMNKFVEENLAYLSNLYMLLKKKGVKDVNAK
jgi:hypothetical protein